MIEILTFVVIQAPLNRLWSSQRRLELPLLAITRGNPIRAIFAAGCATDRERRGEEGALPTRPGTFADRSLDHLVRTLQHRLRKRRTERLRGLEVDHQFELGGLRDGEIARLRTPKNPVDVARKLCDPRLECWVRRTSASLSRQSRRSSAIVGSEYCIAKRPICSRFEVNIGSPRMISASARRPAICAIAFSISPGFATSTKSGCIRSARNACS